MKKMRKGTAVLLLLLSLCVPAVDVSADVGNGLAEYTVEYIARDGETETLLARETYRAPAGRTVNVPHREFDNYIKEAGQDMTLPVTADGKAEKKIKPVILNGSICSHRTADSLASALRSVVTDGTGKRLKSAKCEVAGKTGTARILVNFTRNGKAVSAYQDDEGRKRHQGTFVGFFPADEPEYTAIVVVYSKLSRANFYGGTIPANVLKEIVNSIYCLTPGWTGELECSGKVPGMTAYKIETGADHLDQIPDIKGLGLKDAIYSLENCGYRFEYEGSGHVTGQSPKAGTKAPEGTVVKFTLR